MTDTTFRRLFRAGKIPRPNRRPVNDVNQAADGLGVGDGDRHLSLPDAPHFEGWLRHPRVGVRWGELATHVGDEDAESHTVCSDLRRASDLEHVNAIPPRYIRWVLPAYQIPYFVPSDRMFAFKNGNDPEYVACTWPWAFESQGNDDTIREIVFAMHFSGPILNFEDSDHRNFREHDDRRHARVEQLMLRRHGYIITWLDFEVLRRQTGYNGLLRDSSGVAGTYPDGLHTTLDRFPYHRRVIPSALTNNLAGLPEGLALPSVRALRYYAEQLDKLRAKPAAELTAGERATINRLDDLIRVEYAWEIIH